MRLLTRLGLTIAALALVVSTAGPARAAVLWTLTASPLTVNAGVQTTFHLRASLTLLGEIRCVEVGVPGNFHVAGSAVTGSNAGHSWVSQVAGNDVRVRTTSGGDRLRNLGHYVEFTITGTAWSSGSVSWASQAYDDEDCTGSGSLLSIPPIVLVLGSAATPAPAPTVAPTVPPTPKPTAPPPPLPTLPPITLPSLPPITIFPTPRPSTAVGTPAPTPRTTAAPPPSARATDQARASVEASPSPTTVRPGASSTAVPSPTPQEGTVAGPAGPPAGGGVPEGRIIAEPRSGDGSAPAPMPIALGALGLLGSIDIWIVPGLLLGVPGLLVVAFVILQAIGAMAWIPAIRRLRGEEEMSGAVP
jgi:hypothetical protein